MQENERTHLATTRMGLVGSPGSSCDMSCYTKVEAPDVVVETEACIRAGTGATEHTREAQGEHLTWLQQLWLLLGGWT